MIFNESALPFLFRKSPGEDSSAAGKAGLALWNIIWIIISAVLITYMTLKTAYGTYPEEIFTGYFTNPVIFLMNFIPVFIIMLFLILITGRIWISYLITDLVLVIASAGNFFKLKFRDDPFVFNDITAVKSALQMSGNYEITITDDIQFNIIVSAVLLLILFFTARGRLSIKKRLIGLVIAAVISVPAFMAVTDKNIYTKETVNPEYYEKYSITVNYISRGFVYPFIYDAWDNFDRKPEGYSRSAVESLLSQYSDESISEDEQMNIITIQLESFCDFRRTGVEGILNHTYADYDSIRDESYHGTLITNIFMGGTINSERCFISGLSDIPLFRSNTNTYGWFLRDQGYYTSGSHPYLQWFYNRINIMPCLGMQDYYFTDNHYYDITKSDISYDYALMPEIFNIYKEDLEKRDQPLLSFNISYQGHGPYPDDTRYYDGKTFWNGKGYSKETTTIFNNYLGLLNNTGSHLKNLTESLQNTDEPVMLVLYGDHKPWLGNNNSAYNELGIGLNLNTQDGFYNYYSTEYIIWKNDAARKLTDDENPGEEGPVISVNYLMNLVFEQAGWKGPAYMQYTTDLMKKLPVITSIGFCMEDDMIKPEDQLSDSGLEALKEYRNVEYYMRNNFLYSDLVSQE